jgi:hypothetical protein
MPRSEATEGALAVAAAEKAEAISLLAPDHLPSACLSSAFGLPAMELPDDATAEQRSLHLQAALAAEQQKSAALLGKVQRVEDERRAHFDEIADLQARVSTGRVWGLYRPGRPLDKACRQGERYTCVK